MSDPKGPSSPPNVLCAGEAKPFDDRTALRLIVDRASPRLFREPDNPGNVLKECRQIAIYRLCNADSSAVAKIELLEYLIEIAQKSDGAEVWRALFSELRAKLLQEQESEA
jgi:hypothetical protein